MSAYPEKPSLGNRITLNISRSTIDKALQINRCHLVSRSIMLCSHLMGTKLMRRLPWPLASPIRWFSAGDPGRPSATWYAQHYRLGPARNHRYSLPILRPWHCHHHDDKSDTGPTSFGTASLRPLQSPSGRADLN